MPGLIKVTRIEVDLGQPHDVGPVPGGHRRIIPILGGRFTGEHLSGEVLPIGADWNLVRMDQVMELSALYALRTHDGICITIHNVGMISAPDGTMERMTQGNGPVDQATLYSRIKTHFEAPLHSRYHWLNSALFVGELLPPERMDKVAMEIFKLA